MAFKVWSVPNIIGFRIYPQNNKHMYFLIYSRLTWTRTSVVRQWLMMNSHDEFQKWPLWSPKILSLKRIFVKDKNKWEIGCWSLDVDLQRLLYRSGNCSKSNGEFSVNLMHNNKHFISQAHIRNLFSSEKELLEQTMSKKDYFLEQTMSKKDYFSIFLWFAHRICSLMNN